MQEHVPDGFEDGYLMNLLYEVTVTICVGELFKLKPQMNTDEHRFSGSVSAFIGFHLRLV